MPELCLGPNGVKSIVVVSGGRSDCVCQWFCLQLYGVKPIVVVAGGGGV